MRRTREMSELIETHEVLYEADATRYEFMLVHLDDGGTVLLDFKGAWQGKVSTDKLKEAFCDEEQHRECTEVLLANPMFVWSAIDAKNIIEGATRAMYGSDY
jgi:hypothetical protein